MPDGVVSRVQTVAGAGGADCRAPVVEEEKGVALKVDGRDNKVDQALRARKKKLQREGVFREMKARRAYEKPSERLAREKQQAIRRSRKLARKQAQREGLIPGPKRRAAG